MPTSARSSQSTEADRHGMVHALGVLCATLPVRLVLRLCAQEDFTVEFYNRLDEVGLPLNIVDGLAVEAQDIARHGNDWESLDGLSDRAFLAAMALLQAAAPLVYDAHHGAKRPFVNIPKLRVAMQVGFRGRVLPALLPCVVR
mmetsp:Transcript_11099/g.39235  ORF Transcript_11099/g.39235 Transcript_11099/m.39235 type:complete len:143 (+) Transcript_11099:535-963(+)